MKFIKVTTDEGKEIFVNVKKIWYYYSAEEKGGTWIVLLSRNCDRLHVKECVTTVTRLIEL